MEWVACYESAIEGAARMVSALLEGRGIPCRLESMGGVFPTMGFAVLVPSDQVDAARELIRSETPFEPAEPSSEPELASPERAGASPRTFDVVRGALRFVRAYPVVLLTAVASALSALVLQAIPRAPDATPLAVMRENGPVLLLLLIVETVVQGLAIAFVAEALDGRPSWREAARRLKDRLGQLLLCQILLSLPFLLRAVLGSPSTKTSPAVMGLLLMGSLVFIYLALRLTFVNIALLVDRTDVGGAFRASWSAAGHTWPIILGLIVLGGIVSLPFAFVPWARLGVGSLLGVVGTVAWVITYRASTGRLTAS